MRSFIRLLTAALLACTPFLALAGVVTGAAPSWTFPSANTAVIGESGSLATLLEGRVIGPSAADPLAAAFGDMMRMPLGGNLAAGTTERVAFQRVATAAAVNTALADALALGAVGYASYQIASAVRCKVLGAGATGCDDGTDAETKLETVYQIALSDRTVEGSSASSTCSTAVGVLNAQNVTRPQSGGGSIGVVFTGSATSETRCVGTRTETQVNSGGGVYTGVGGFGLDIGKTIKNQRRCPEVLDALNPANSIPAGGPEGADGKCPTGRYASKTSQQIADKISKVVDATVRIDALKEWLADPRGKVVAQPGTLTGPATVTGQPTTVTTSGPQGTTTTTTTPRTGYAYDGEKITATDQPTVVTRNPDGTTTTSDGTPTKIDIETCGLPGKPPCKIDETGTPTQPPTPPTVPDDLKTDDAAKRDAAIAAIRDPGFGWIAAPPIASCYAFDWPAMGSTYTLDPCAPMEQIRGIMAYVWALFAFWWSIGLVRKTFAGG